MIYGMLSTKPIGKFPKKQWCEWLDSKNRCKRKCYNDIVVRSREGWSNGSKDGCEMFTTSIKWSQYPTNLWIILSPDIPHTKCCQDVGVDVYIRFQGSAFKPLTPQAMIRCLQGRRQDQWMCSSSTTNSAISQITSWSAWEIYRNPGRNHYCNHHRGREVCNIQNPFSYQKWKTHSGQKFFMTFLLGGWRKSHQTSFAKFGEIVTAGQIIQIGRWTKVTRGCVATP